MYIYNLKLINGCNIKHVVAGNFSGRNKTEIIAAHNTVLELLEVENDRIYSHFCVELFCRIHSLAVLEGRDNDFVVIGSDSGYALVLKCIAESRTFVPVFKKKYGIPVNLPEFPGHFVATSRYGIVIGSLVENQLFYYNFAHKSKLDNQPIFMSQSRFITFDFVGMKLSDYRLPVFASLETLCEEGVDDPSNLKQFLKVYEVCPRKQIVSMKNQRLPQHANKLISVPKGKMNPCGIIVCYENKITFKPFAIGYKELTAFLPQRKNDAFNSKRGFILTSSTLCNDKGSVVVLAQSEQGDLFSIRIKESGDKVLELKIIYIDTIPVASSMCIVAERLFIAVEFGDNFLYKINSLGKEEEMKPFKRGKLVTFVARKLENLSILDSLKSVAPVMQFFVSDLACNDIKKMFFACGRGPSSTLRTSRIATEVATVYQMNLPPLSNTVFSVSEELPDGHKITYVVVSLMNGTMLLVFDKYMYISDDGGAFHSDGPTLNCSQCTKDSIIQVYPAGFRYIRNNKYTEYIINEDERAAGRDVLHCALHGKQVALALVNKEGMYFEIKVGKEEVSFNQMQAKANFKSTVMCMRFIPRRIRAKHLAVCLEDCLEIYCVNLTGLQQLTTYNLEKIPESLVVISCIRSVDVDLNSVIHIGYQDGTVQRIAANEEVIKSEYSIKLGSKPVKLHVLPICNTTAVLALTDRAWISFYNSQGLIGTFTPFDFGQIDEVTAFSAKCTAKANVLAKFNKTLYFLTVNNTASMINDDIVKLTYTPNIFVFNPKNNLLIISETDRRPPYHKEDEITPQKAMDLASKPPESQPKTKEMRLASVWDSLLHIYDPNEKKTVLKKPLAINETAVSMSLVHLGEENLLYLLVGVKQGLLVEGVNRESNIYMYGISDDGKSFSLVLKTVVEDVPHAICPVENYVLIGVGNKLCLYKFNQSKKTLVRCAMEESRNPIHAIWSRRNFFVVKTSDERLTYGYLGVKEASLNMIHQDRFMRAVTCLCFWDDDIIFVGDRKSISVVLLPYYEGCSDKPPAGPEMAEMFQKMKIFDSNISTSESDETSSDTGASTSSETQSPSSGDSQSSDAFASFKIKKRPLHSKFKQFPKVSRLSTEASELGPFVPVAGPSTVVPEYGLFVPKARPSTVVPEYGLFVPKARPSTEVPAQAPFVPAAEHGPSVPVSKPSTEGPELGPSVPVAKPSTEGHELRPSLPVAQPSSDGPVLGSSVPIAEPSTEEPELGPVSEPSSVGPVVGPSVPVAEPSTEVPEHRPSVPVTKLSTKGPEHGQVAEPSTEVPEHRPSVPVTELSTKGPEHRPSVPVTELSTKGPEHRPSVPVTELSTKGPEHRPSVPVIELSTKGPEHGPVAEPSSEGPVVGPSVLVAEPSTLGPEPGPSGSFAEPSTVGPEHGPSAPVDEPSTVGPELGPSAPVAEPSTVGPELGPSAPVAELPTEGTEHGPSVPVAELSIVEPELGSSVPVVQPPTEGPEHGPSMPVAEPSTEIPERGPSVSIAEPSTEASEFGSERASESCTEASEFESEHPSELCTEASEFGSERASESCMEGSEFGSERASESCTETSECGSERASESCTETSECGSERASESCTETSECGSERASESCTETSECGSERASESCTEASDFESVRASDSCTEASEFESVRAADSCTEASEFESVRASESCTEASELESERASESCTEASEFESERASESCTEASEFESERTSESSTEASQFESERTSESCTEASQFESERASESCTEASEFESERASESSTETSEFESVRAAESCSEASEFGSVRGAESCTEAAELEPVRGAESCTEAAELEPVRGAESCPEAAELEPVRRVDSCTEAAELEPERGAESCTEASELGPVRASESCTEGSEFGPVRASDSCTEASELGSVRAPESCTEASELGPVHASESCTEASELGPVHASESCTETSELGPVRVAESCTEAAELEPVRGAESCTEASELGSERGTESCTEVSELGPSKSNTEAPELGPVCASESYMEASELGSVRASESCTDASESGSVRASGSCTESSESGSVRASESCTESSESGSVRASESCTESSESGSVHASESCTEASELGSVRGSESCMDTSEVGSVRGSESCTEASELGSVPASESSSEYFERDSSVQTAESTEASGSEITVQDVDSSMETSGSEMSVQDVESFMETSGSDMSVEDVESSMEISGSEMSVRADDSSTEVGSELSVQSDDSSTETSESEMSVQETESFAEASGPGASPSGSSVVPYIHESSFLRFMEYSYVLIQYKVGEYVKSVQKTSLVKDGRELIVYTTMSGSVGVLVPFLNETHHKFFGPLEYLIFKTSLLLTSDWLQPLRPERGNIFLQCWEDQFTIDGNACEVFNTFPQEVQNEICEQLDASLSQVQQKIEEMKRTAYI